MTLKCAFSLSKKWLHFFLWRFSFVWKMFFMVRQKKLIIMKIVIMTISHWHVTKIIGCHFTIHAKNVFVRDSACEFFPSPIVSVKYNCGDKSKSNKSYLNGSEGGYRKHRFIQFYADKLITHSNTHSLTLRLSWRKVSSSF